MVIGLPITYRFRLLCYLLKSHQGTLDTSEINLLCRKHIGQGCDNLFFASDSLIPSFLKKRFKQSGSRKSSLTLVSADQGELSTKYRSGIFNLINCFLPL